MCGIFGIYGDDRAAALTTLGLHALQHRGQESAGIVSSDRRGIFWERDMGLVNEVFTPPRLKKLPGSMAIGHVRYSTTGASDLSSAQPFLVDGKRGQIALAHNGNLPYANVVRDELDKKGSIFMTHSDTEVVLHKLAISGKDSLLDAIVEVFEEDVMDGAYSMLFLTNRSIIALRDPRGFRPLCLGKLDNAWVVASETCALELIDAEYVRDVEPGEMIVINQSGPRSVHQFGKKEINHCIFEHVYFARPDSLVFGQSVNESRHKAGRALAREHPCPTADMVIPIPDSGMVAASGYAQESGIRLRPTGLVRNHYVGRSFILPDEDIRDLTVKLKLSPTRDLIQGNRVVLIDDSIVRGNTLRKIVRMVRSAGATEVHVRIACPPTVGPCYYGVDTPNRSRLIAANKSVDEIREAVGADSLAFLSLEGLVESCQDHSGDLKWCSACYTNTYPLEVNFNAKTKAEKETG